MTNMSEQTPAHVEQTGIKVTISRSSLANGVAAFVVIGGAIYFMITKDTESLKWIVAGSLGWLFKEITAKR